MKLKFTWPSFISLLLVVFILSYFQAVKVKGKKENFENGKAVDMKLTPEGCCDIDEEWNKLEMHTQETWGLEGNRQTCMMLYGEYCPRTKFGVAGPQWPGEAQDPAYYVQAKAQ